MTVEEVYKQITAVKRATTCVGELVEMMLAEDEGDDEDVLIKVHTIMVSLLKCSGAFVPMGVQAADARGAIAEVMCKYVIERWLKIRGIDGYVINGVLLPVYPNTQGRDDTTEIDIALVTDRAICIIECKSFKGNKTTDGKFIATKNIRKQPWDQNQGHLVAFKNNAKKHFPEIVLPIIYNVVYMFAEGKFIEWQFPYEEGRRLMLNLGAFATLDEMYNGSNSVMSKADVASIANFLRQNEPSVEQQTEHVMRIKDLL